MIRAQAGPSEIVITTTSRLAGAIHSLTWNGMEFINSTDHGRQLQSASNLDTSRPIHNETYNPTEAGSRDDGAGPASSSRLLELKAGGADLQTTTQMAFWLPPGGASGGFSAYNTTVLSNHLLKKHVHIGHNKLPHAIEYDVDFVLPHDERHTRAVFEALTGYMPPAFRVFWGFDRTTGQLRRLPERMGEQPLPIVLATENGSHAMGVFAPPVQPTLDTRPPGYGQFTFPAQKVNKWNCVFRVHNPAGIPPGHYRYRMFVLVGTLENVRDTMAQLAREFPEKK